jgi:hypothetical protein
LKAAGCDKAERRLCFSIGAYMSKLFSLMLLLFVGCGGSAFSAGGDDDDDDDTGGRSGTGANGSGGITSGGSGGIIGSGGSSGMTGGNTGIGGQTAECVGMKFYMLPPEVSTTIGGYCVEMGCGVSWISIGTAEYPLTLEPPCNDAVCGSCMPLGCTGAACALQPLTAEGAVYAWDGSYYEQSSCGDGTACWSRVCAPPGTYTVRMCAFQALSTDPNSCTPSDVQSCTDTIGFELGSAPELAGRIYP